MTSIPLGDALSRPSLDQSADSLLLLVAAVVLAIGIIAAIALVVESRRGIPAPPKRSEHGVPIDSWGVAAARRERERETTHR
jgi:hypothetical protein